MVVIGGGDTGTDCVGTSVRHGCKTVTLEIMPRLTSPRTLGRWPKVYKLDYGQEGRRGFRSDRGLPYDWGLGDEDGNLRAWLSRYRMETGWRTIHSQFRFRQEILHRQLFWQWDFLGRRMIAEELGLERDARSMCAGMVSFLQYHGVFAAGDMRRGRLWSYGHQRRSSRSPRMRRVPHGRNFPD